MTLRRTLLIVIVAMIAVAACGSDGAPPATAPENTTTTTRPENFSSRVVHGVRATDDPAVMEVLIDAPKCDERHEPQVYQRNDGFDVFVKSYPVDVPADCEVVEVAVRVDLGEPLGERVVRAGGYGREYRRVGDQFELVPESTPCGRADCSTPAPVLAPCTTEAYDAAIQQIDAVVGGPSDVRCDGSFLVLTVRLGGGACPRENENCRMQRAYFVSRAGAWNLVGYNQVGTYTCAEVARRALITFPAALCSS